MRLSERVARLGRITSVVFLGSAFFFTIIGVFGQPFAIAGLVLFVFSAIAIYRKFPTESASL